MSGAYMRFFMAGIALIIGFSAGYFYFDYKHRNLHPREGELHDTNEQFLYPHVSPLLACDNAENITNGDLRTIENEVEDFIDTKVARGTLRDGAVYFRDLNNGPWFSTNSRERFSAASLLKVSVLISFLKFAEADPTVLDRQITYTQKVEYTNQNISPQKVLELGKTYSVSELLEQMISNSDNEAAALIIGLISDEHLKESFKDLALELPDPNKDYTITVRDYASFFRILFNATYLTPKSSELAMQLLIHTHFKDGLVAGVPEGIEVAHKFGERIINGEEAVKQLHDCGIIYAPGKPYLLCVMTRGSDFAELKKTIAEISKMVYTGVVKL